MAKLDRQTVLDAMSRIRPGARTPAATTTTPTDTGTMTAQQVQQVLGAPQASAQLGTEGLFTGGLGQTGRGAWYSMLGPGNAVTDYQELMQAAPGPYVNNYRPAINQLMNGLLNAKPFSYDVNADGLYQQIKDNYMKAARQGMMDTQAQSAALTGGYGNSYGAQAGQQAYQESLGNLTAMVPELYNMAYQRYLQDKDDQRNNLEAMYKLEGQDYARWLEEAQAYRELLASLPPAALAGAGGGNAVYRGPAENYGTSNWSAGVNNTLYPDEIAYYRQGIAEGVITPADLPYMSGIHPSTVHYLQNQAYGLYAPTPGAEGVDTMTSAAPTVPWYMNPQSGQTGTGTQTGTQTGTGEQSGLYRWGTQHGYTKRN